MQLMLWADLPIPEDAAAHCQRRLRIGTPWRDAVSVLLCLKQRALPMHLRELERDVDTAFDFPLHGRVPATEATPVKTVAFASIFSMADAAKAARDLRRRGRFGANECFAPAPYRVERTVGSVRVVRLRPEETEDWQERERQRRARQRPPKPSKKAKTRSAKLLELIGDDDSQEP